MSGKEKLDQEISIPSEVEEWGNLAEVQCDNQTSEDQQELAESQVHSENEIVEKRNKKSHLLKIKLLDTNQLRINMLYNQQEKSNTSILVSFLKTIFPKQDACLY